MEKSKLGVLLIHGWTGSIAMMQPLVEPIQALMVPVVMASLKGHDADTFDLLKTVKWQQWVQDGQTALYALLEKTEKAIIVGHSMGGMIALNLAANHPDAVASVVTAGTPGRMLTPFAPGNKLHWLFNLLWHLLPRINKGAKYYSDPALKELDDSPEVVPTSCVNELFKFLKTQDKYLPNVHVPLLIIQSRKDQVVAPESAEFLFNKTGTPTDQKQIRWFHRTDHGMFLDLEAEDVIASVVAYVQVRKQLVS